MPKHTPSTARAQPEHPSASQAGCAAAQPAQPLFIIQDSREQLPFRFEGFPVTVEVGTLEAGDYSLAGFSRRIAIERKSLADLVGCLGTDRERFTRELARLRGYDAAAVVVESPAFALRAGRFLGGLNPAAAWQSIVALSMRYRVPFFWGKDRADAEGIAFDFLRHFHRDRVRELAALTAAPTAAPAAPEGEGRARTGATDGDAPQTNLGRAGGVHSTPSPSRVLSRRSAGIPQPTPS